jgi:hypothetical protein
MKPNLRHAAPELTQQPCQPELPLTKKSDVLPSITLQQVWTNLDRQQRDRVFQQLVSICCRLALNAKPEEKSSIAFHTK